MDFAEVRAKAKRMESSVALCMDGLLFAEHEDAERRLAATMREPAQATLGGGDPARLAADEVREIEARMKEATVVFRFRALGKSEYAALRNDPAHKPTDGSDDAFADSLWLDLVAHCCIDPVMSISDATGLFEELSEGQRSVLAGAAWEVNQSRADIPFSSLASAATR